MSKNDETTSGQESKPMNNRIMENNIFDVFLDLTNSARIILYESQQPKRTP